MEKECNCLQRLLTVEEVSDLLQVSKSWIYDEVEAARFPVVRVGRRLRFRLTDIQDYLSGSWTPASLLRTLEPHASRR